MLKLYAETFKLMGKFIKTQKKFLKNLLQRKMIEHLDQIQKEQKMFHFQFSL